jgi:hypothetical protein
MDWVHMDSGVDNINISMWLEKLLRELVKGKRLRKAAQQVLFGLCKMAQI